MLIIITDARERYTYENLGIVILGPASGFFRIITYAMYIEQLRTMSIDAIAINTRYVGGYA